MLQFDSREDVKMVIDILKKADDAWKQRLENSNEVAPTQNTLASNMFDRFYPYKVFEEKLGGFQSLRSVIEGREVAWLQTTELDMAQNPDYHFVLYRPKRALLNEFSEIMVGNHIVKEYDGGNIVELLQYDENQLKAMRNIRSIAELDKMLNVVVVQRDANKINRQSCPGA